MSTSAQSILDHLKTLGDPRNVEGMRRYGVGGAMAFGVGAVPMRAIAREVKHGLGAADRHALALELWASGWREARLVAAMIEDPALATRDQIDAWLGGIDSWDVCDGLCNELVRRVPWVWDAIVPWCRHDHEYTRRAGFVALATLAVHAKKEPDERFTAHFPEILRGATDPRNAVKKGVNWAIRQIGKRNPALNTAAIELAEDVKTLGTPPARWIASDALRELRSAAVQARLATRHDG